MTSRSGERKSEMISERHDINLHLKRFACLSGLGGCVERHEEEMQQHEENEEHVKKKSFPVWGVCCARIVACQTMLKKDLSLDLFPQIRFGPILVQIKLWNFYEIDRQHSDKHGLFRSGLVIISLALGSHSSSGNGQFSTVPRIGVTTPDITILISSELSVKGRTVMMMAAPQPRKQISSSRKRQQEQKA